MLLIQLAHKNFPFKWTTECETAKTTLITKNTSAPILRFPISDKQHEFTLYTDASCRAAGALLAQVQNGAEHPIAFYSKVFSPQQCRWASAELELAGIGYAVNHFRDYLIGTHFTILTDNAAFTHILQRPTLAPKLQRWTVTLKEFNFTIKHLSAITLPTRR